MKTAAILAAMFCAHTASAQPDRTDSEPLAGLIASLELEYETDTSVFATVAGERIEDTFRRSQEETIAVPGPSRIDSDSRLRIGDALGETRSEINLSTGAARIDGTYFASTSATTPDEAILPQTRLFERFEVEATELSVIADVVLTINGSVSSSGFGSSLVSWSFLTDGRGENGSFRNDASVSEQFVFEDVDLTRFEFGFSSRLSAGLDAPVLNSDASAQLEWSIEILPIPGPGTAALLALVGIAGLRRRR